MSIGTEQPAILFGEKFALLAVPKVNATALATNTTLGNNCRAMRTLPVELAGHWQQWIGEIKVRQLGEAGFYLLATSATAEPAVLDGDNQRLIRQVCTLWNGLLIVHTPYAAAAPILLTGANVHGNPDVRQISELRQPVRLAFNQNEIQRFLETSDLHVAVSFAEVLSQLSSKQSHERLKRAVSAFFTGVHESRIEERLHQFCRCVDGIIFSGKGRGESDFISRTADFIGDGQADMLREIYRMRSAVEHLRPVESEADGVVNLRDQRRRVLERAVQAEWIARQAVQRVLGDTTLFDIFGDDDQIKDFWNRITSERRSMLTPPQNFDRILHELVDPKYITDQDIGLT